MRSSFLASCWVDVAAQHQGNASEDEQAPSNRTGEQKTSHDGENSTEPGIAGLGQAAYASSLPLSPTLICGTRSSTLSRVV